MFLRYDVKFICRCPGHDIYLNSSYVCVSGLGSVDEAVSGGKPPAGKGVQLVY